MIGNSHLGPVAQASARRILESPGLLIGHYIDRTYGKVPLRLVGDATFSDMPSILIEESSDISSAVDIAKWDKFVVVGLGFSVIRLVEHWTVFQPDALPFTVGEHLLVPDLVDGYNDAVMDSTKAMNLIRGLRSMTTKPISLVPAPLPAAWVQSRLGERFDPFHTFRNSNSRAYLVDQFENQVNRVRALDVDVLAPPEDAIIDQIWTKNEFCLGEPSNTYADSFYSRGDFYHMNREYGERVSRKIFRDFIGVR